MKKFLIAFFSILLVILLPIGGFFIYGECIAKDVYTETYYAELKDKTERLSSREKHKIVFIGGSSLIFGLRSEEIEKATGYDVVDYGLYASLGTPIMMKLAEPYIKSGDVVILAPEINSQTYSDYIGYDVALKCFENMNYPFRSFSMDETMRFFFHYFGYQIEKGNANITLEAPYDKASFNEYGDIDNEIVKNNILPIYYDPTQPIEPSGELLNKNFIDIVNKYNKKLTKRGAQLFFSFSPTNALALNEEHLDIFNKDIEEKLDCPILGSVKDFTYHQYYFYDTNFHLNRSGSYLHSHNLVKCIKEALEIENTYEIEVPDMPKPEHSSTSVVVTINHMQLLESYAGGKFNYRLVGLDDTLKGVTEFKVPTTANGFPIKSIGRDAFKDMPNLTKVIVPSEVNSIIDTPFNNCPNMMGLYLEHQYPPTIPASGLLGGTNVNSSIYVQSKYIKNYISGYTWLDYRSRIKPY